MNSDFIVKKFISEALMGFLIFMAMLILFTLGFMCGVARTETEYNRVERKARELEQMRAVVISNFFYNLQDAVKKNGK